MHWGDQTYDEMMVGFFDVAVRADLDKWKFFVRLRRAKQRIIKFRDLEFRDFAEMEVANLHGGHHHLE